MSYSFYSGSVRVSVLQEPYGNEEEAALSQDNKKMQVYTTNPWELLPSLGENSSTDKRNSKVYSGIEKNFSMQNLNQPSGPFGKLLVNYLPANEGSAAD